MTRKQAGIVRHNAPTRATKRGSLDRYCRSMQFVGGGKCRDFYGQTYEWRNGSLRKMPTFDRTNFEARIGK